MVGGKAASLSRLMTTYRVPPGFCWVVDGEALPGAKHIAQAELPDSVRDRLIQAYGQLAQQCGIPEPAVAVRSSAVDEDSAASSFAGQHETLLNVRGQAAMLEAVVRCWSSALSPNALAYRIQRGLSADRIRFAVLVQQMVQADAAAVAFSLNPTTGATDEIVINANWGLGESVVGGEVTPDMFVIRKRDGAITARHLGDKAHMTVTSSNGVALVETPQTRRHQPSLSDSQIAAIATLVTELESEQDAPVDVECAFEGDHLYLLQSRPVTALEEKEEKTEAATPLAPPPSIDPDSVGWDNAADAEKTWRNAKGLVLPLQQSISLYYYQGWAKAFREGDVVGGLRARYICGYQYRLWEWKSTKPWPETEARQIELEQQLPDRWHQAWLPAIQADLAEWQAVDLESLAHDALATFLHTMLNRQLNHWAIHAQMGSLPLSAVQRLVDWYLERFLSAPETEPYRLLQGQSNVSVEGNHHLWQLSRSLTPDVTSALQNGRWDQLPGEFATAFAEYCDRFGQQTPRQQQRAAQLVLHYAAHDVADPYLIVEALAAEREAFIQAVKGRLSDEEHSTFERLLTCALANNPLTEDHNLWLDQKSDAATRRVTAEFARRLVENGSLQDPDEIEYLSIYELIQWGFGLGNPIGPVVEARKAEYEQYRQITPPEFLGKPPEPSSGHVNRFSGPATPLPAGPGFIQGIGASAGTVRGLSRVAKDLESAMILQPGEILVCPTTDPTWTPLFAVAGALVTESGGSLCHAAVVAREYQLPAVVGTHTATHKIRTGQWLEVDGKLGVVHLIDFK